MAKKLSELSINELACSLIATEKSAGANSDGATALRSEVARRAASDKIANDVVGRARRFAALIDSGSTMEEFHGDGFTVADRRLALSLGAKPRPWRLTPGSFNVFRKKRDGGATV